MYNQLPFLEHLFSQGSESTLQSLLATLSQVGAQWLASLDSDLGESEYEKMDLILINE